MAESEKSQKREVAFKETVERNLIFSSSRCHEVREESRERKAYVKAQRPSMFREVSCSYSSYSRGIRCEVVGGEGGSQGSGPDNEGG